MQQISVGLRADRIRQLRCHRSHWQTSRHARPVRHGRPRRLGPAAHHVLHVHRRVHRLLLRHGAGLVLECRREMGARNKAVHAQRSIHFGWHSNRSERQFDIAQGLESQASEARDERGGREDGAQVGRSRLHRMFGIVEREREASVRQCHNHLLSAEEGEKESFQEAFVRLESS